MGLPGGQEGGRVDDPVLNYVGFQIPLLVWGFISFTPINHEQHLCGKQILQQERTHLCMQIKKKISSNRHVSLVFPCVYSPDNMTIYAYLDMQCILLFATFIITQRISKLCMNQKINNIAIISSQTYFLHQQSKTS